MFKIVFIILNIILLSCLVYIHKEEIKTGTVDHKDIIIFVLFTLLFVENVIWLYII